MYADIPAGRQTICHDRYILPNRFHCGKVLQPTQPIHQPDSVHCARVVGGPRADSGFQQEILSERHERLTTPHTLDCAGTTADSAGIRFGTGWRLYRTARRLPDDTLRRLRTGLRLSEGPRDRERNDARN